jgi:hypothetical protein
MEESQARNVSHSPEAEYKLFLELKAKGLLDSFLGGQATGVASISVKSDGGFSQSSCHDNVRPDHSKPSPEARVEWEDKARDIAIWQTGGISGFADDREIVLDAWTVQIADALQAAFEKGRRSNG